VKAPVIESERIRLRGHTLHDLDACAAMWAMPEVTRFIGGKPSTRDETWSRLLRYAGSWSMLGYGYWLAEERTTGRLIGEVGFGNWQRDITPALDVPEMGWALLPWAQGKGLATEGVMAGLRWSDATYAEQTVTCIISPENTPSIRVAEKCGFREHARTLFKGDPTIIFRRSGSDARRTA
jgi:RimJ/RimL family protein N-acetyltransferase